MTDPPGPDFKVSVVVVSRGRPAWLRRCVAAIGQLDYRALELVVVADPGGLAALGPGEFKAVEFDQANISAARNLGLDLAAGEIVAFIDDDSVPEPTWVGRLAEAFRLPRVAAAGGFVRGRNGLSFLWRAVEVDRNGSDHPIEVDPERVSIHVGSAERAVKTQGTNCAFRRSVLVELGGFDEGLEFYLDEADANLRIAAAGHLTAVVPRAEVHHGLAESPRRSSERTPLTLFDVGASTAVFLRRHAPEEEWEPALVRLRAGQRERLDRFAEDTRLSSQEVKARMESLEAGIVAGLRRTLPTLAPRPGEPPEFLPLPGTGPRPGRLLAGRPWSRARLAARAEAAAGSEIVTVLRLSPTARPHQVSYRPEGYWEQTGGLFGRAEREEPRFRPWSFGRRVRAEAGRIARVRPVRPSGDANP